IMTLRRALHFVFKVGDRQKTATFYREVLGMKVLRHEEFEEGCKATCNGTSVLRLIRRLAPFYSTVSTSLYWGIRTHTDLQGVVSCQGLTVWSSQAVSNARRLGWPLTEVGEGTFFTEAPGGYRFYLLDKAQPEMGESQQELVSLVSPRSGAEGCGYTVCTCCRAVCGNTVCTCSHTVCVCLQCKLELQDIGAPVDHGTAFGRIAFSCPREQQDSSQHSLIEKSALLLLPLVESCGLFPIKLNEILLFHVVFHSILQDGHEICFVGDEAFRELSRMDPNGNSLLDAAMAADKSAEWFARHNKQKASA
ncbi:GLOD4 protein, partial [Atractosteus spatula]|nr:GLOD4 protein [Atractosteus spatula]